MAKARREGSERIEGIDEAAAALAAAVRAGAAMTVLTGAGVSAESGIPTFRGAQGLWRGFRHERLATPDAFARDAATVWGWYHWRRSIVADANPNAAHVALAALERVVSDFTLVTQNVDGLHSRAGSRRVLELHGNIHYVRCTRCEKVAPLPPEAEGIVACEACGGRGRPHIVWFGEMLPEDVWQQASAAVARSGVLFVIGTSAAVYPAAALMEYVAAKGGLVVEINPEDTPLSRLATYALRAPAGTALPALLERAGFASA